MSLRKHFADLMVDVGATDPDLVVIVSDISHGILGEFATRHPNRYFNMGICEPSIVNMAAGLNHVGLNPVVHTIAPFLVERSFEQLKLDFGYQRKSVNLVSVGGAFDYSKLGCSHHSYSDVALVSQIPGSAAFMPASIAEFDHLFRTAYQMSGIKYYRLTEYPHGVAIPPLVGLASGGVHLFEGTDVTLAVTGAQLGNAVEAERILRGRGISVDLFYFPTLKPFDGSLLKRSVRRTRRAVSVEELSDRDGLFARLCEVSAGLAEVRLEQLAIRDFIHEYGSYEDLCRIVGLDVPGIVGAVEALLEH